MKIHPVIAVLVLSGLTACSKSPSVSEIDGRLQKMEAQLAHIESVLKQQAVNETITEAVKNQATIFVTGKVARPGQYTVARDTSLLAAIAVAGGFDNYANQKMVTISKAGQEDRIITDSSTFKDILLAEGDVVIVPETIK